jgi:CBS domain-containing protein
MDTPAKPRAACAEPVLVASLMSTSPVTIDARAEAHVAARFARIRGVHHLLVIDEGQLIGIACLCDMETAPTTRRVGALGRTSIVFVNSSATAEAAAQMMADYGVGCLPVLDPNGGVAGIVSRKDLRNAGFLAGELGVDLCAACGTGHHLRTRSGSDNPVFCAPCLEATPSATDVDSIYLTLGGSG